MTRLLFSRGRLIAALLLSLVQPALAGVTPSDFEYRAAITVAPVQQVVPARVALPETVLRHAATDFSDVRLFDAQQRETPYVIYPATEASLRREYFGLKVLAYRDLPQGCEIVLERPEKRASLDGIAVETLNRDFQKAITVESSSDRAKWKTVQRDSLFDFSSKINLRRNEIRLPRVTDRYLRLTLIDPAGATESAPSDLQVRYQGMELQMRSGANKTPFHIQSVEAWSGENEKRDAVLERLVLNKPSVEINHERESAITVDLGHLPVRSLEINVDGTAYYYRQVQVWARSERTEKFDRWVASGWIYHLPGMARPETRINLPDRMESPLQIRVLNGDNPPLSIASLRFEWPRADLFFFPQPESTYTLYYGAKEMNRPDYDIARIIPRPSTSEGDNFPLATVTAAIGDTAKNPTYKAGRFEVNEQSQRALLVSVVAGLGLCLGYWAYMLLKKSNP